MFLFITGRQNSGKSEYAEKRACELNEKRFYLATMKVMDEEGQKRVKRHRELRSGKGFITIECEKDVDALGLERDSVVLLECISNLVGNEMFSDNEPKSVDYTISKVLAEVKALASKVDNIVVVSSIYEDADVTMDDQTLAYMETLKKVNEELTRLSDEAVVVNRDNENN